MTCGIGRSSTATPLTEAGDATRPRSSDLLHRIALLAIAAPRRTIAIAGLITLAAGVFGIPVAQSLSASGFADPASESARAATTLTDKFGQGDVQLLFVVSAPDGVTSRSARGVGTEIADQLSHSAHVTSVTSAWTAPPPAAASLISNDNRSGLIVAGISGGESGRAVVGLRRGALGARGRGVCHADRRRLRGCGGVEVSARRIRFPSRGVSRLERSDSGCAARAGSGRGSVAATGIESSGRSGSAGR